MRAEALEVSGSTKRAIVATLSLPLVLGASVAIAEVRNTEREQATCKEIGFTPKTQAFGDCVMELISRGVGSKPARQASPPSPENVNLAALTPNQRTCAGYGFKKGTTVFAQCQMDLDAAQRQAEAQQQQFQFQQQQYQQQVAAYEAQAAAIKRERDRRKWETLARIGAGMASSSSPTFLGGLSDGMAAGSGITVARPAPPSPPAMQTYTIRTPNGTQVCTYISASRYMSCQ